MDDSSAMPQEEAKAAVATAAATVDKSPLYKPLRELTEDDIAQVTREDCRRFLKEKGMRRPSWNKSQAIQQVISLKALLEARKEDGDDDNNNAGFCSPPPIIIQDSPALALPPPLPDQQQRGVTEQKRDRPSLPPPSLPMTSREMACVPTRDVSDPAMTTASAAGQMTVFYDGKVNVYDGVPPEKALIIMQLAASPGDHDGPPSSLVDLNQSFIHSQLNPIQNITLRPPPPPMVTTTQAKASMTPIRIPHYPQGAERKNLHEVELEGPACRKALLQRYFDKRKKDRRTLTCKKKMERLSSSGVDFHLDRNFRYQSTNGQHYESDIITRCPGNLNS